DEEMIPRPPVAHSVMRRSASSRRAFRLGGRFASSAGSAGGGPGGWGRGTGPRRTATSPIPTAEWGERKKKGNTNGSFQCVAHVGRIDEAGNAGLLQLLCGADPGEHQKDVASRPRRRSESLP